MLLTFYTLLTVLTAPLIHLYLLKRKKAGKEDPRRFRERLGYASQARPEGKLLWIHAASVGESLSVLPLLERLVVQFPTITILLTTGTVTSAALMKARLPAGAIHQFIPVDSFFAVKRFLRHWQPTLALWVESELWPNLLKQTAKTCPLVLVNARISDRSFATWRKHPVISQTLLKYFALCLPQSKQDAERLEVLGAPNVSFIGNLKYDAPPLPCNKQELEALRTVLGDRPVWLAASTHPGEEEIIAEAHHALKHHYPNLLTTIVPRHARRGAELSLLLTGLDCNVALRSSNQLITPETDIYLADTMGELGIFYRLCPVVLMGGTLVPHGGQNPLEAARLRCALIAGPSMENFRDIIQELVDNGACSRVSDASSLAVAVDALWQDKEKRERMAQAAYVVAAGKGEIIGHYIAAIAPFVEGNNAV